MRRKERGREREREGAREPKTKGQRAQQAKCSVAADAMDQCGGQKAHMETTEYGS